MSIGAAFPQRGGTRSAMAYRSKVFVTRASSGNIADPGFRRIPRFPNLLRSEFVD
ncbi:hypothetical protein [Methylobacterium sp. J-090]|uniref:hypothetical protein n=1 Tax=Methylobacterium sp. J-090 TaxID=2836666 RepID=UPI001FBAA032|nr:hypothetical protein [Methylobacterium sp. J-090]MCJ2083708.1 hypothetical protein [Methylobacterium sp. J-090]